MKKQIMIRRFFEAFGMLLATVASIHLVVVFSLSILHHDLHYINPLYYFGMSEVFPQYIHSNVIVGIGWIFLVILLLISVYLLRNYDINFVTRKKTIKKD
jgi:hypothetical protein